MVKSCLRSRDISSVMINLITVKLLFTYPRFMIERCENGAWISVVVYGIAALLLFGVTGILYKRCEKLSLLTQAEYIGGKLFKIITGVFVILLFMLNIAPMVRAFPEAIKTALLQNSPMLFITLILSCGVIVGVYYGIEALSRLASLFLPVAALFLLVFTVLLAPEFEINNLFPLSVRKAVTEGTTSLSVFSDILVLNFLLIYCENADIAVRAGIKAIITGIITGASVTFVYCLIYPYPASSRFIVPLYQMSRIVTVGTYFQRLEAVFEFVWSVSIFLYTAVYLFVMCDIFRQSFNLKDYRPLAVPMLLVLMMLVFREESYVKTLRANFVSSMILFPMFYLLPLIYGGLFLAKKKKKESR